MHGAAGLAWWVKMHQSTVIKQSIDSRIGSPVSDKSIDRALVMAFDSSQNSSASVVDPPSI